MAQIPTESKPVEAFQRASGKAAGPGDILALQRTVGNRAVQRMLAESKRPKLETGGGNVPTVQRQKGNECCEINSRRTGEHSVRIKTNEFWTDRNFKNVTVQAGRIWTLESIVGNLENRLNKHSQGGGQLV